MFHWLTSGCDNNDDGSEYITVGGGKTADEVIGSKPETNYIFEQDNAGLSKPDFVHAKTDSEMEWKW